MLNIEIRLYGSDDIGGKYNSALLSHEDDGVQLAHNIFKSENFEILVEYLSYFSETVGRGISYSKNQDRSYMSEVFGRVFKLFREDSERYEKFLEYSLLQVYEVQ